MLLFSFIHEVPHNSVFTRSFHKFLSCWNLTFSQAVTAKIFQRVGKELRGVVRQDAL